jgi:hypothetical protein
MGLLVDRFGKPVAFREGVAAARKIIVQVGKLFESVIENMRVIQSNEGGVPSPRRRAKPLRELNFGSQGI